MNQSHSISLSATPKGEMRLGSTPPHCNQLNNSDLIAQEHNYAPPVPPGTSGA